MVGYTIGNLVLRQHASGAVKRDFRTYIRRNTSQMKNLNMVNPIIMLFCSFVWNLSVASFMPHIIQRNVTSLMMSNYFRQYIAGYTVANIWRYPIRCSVAKANALESVFGTKWKRYNIIWASAWDFQQCGMCDQQRLRPAWAYAQSDQSLC